MWSEWNVPPVELDFVLSARSRVVSSQLRLHETIDYSVSNCFMNIKMKSIIINVETNFRHADHSAAFVSGRLLRFHIPKFRHYFVIFVIIARATIEQRIKLVKHDYDRILNM